MRFGVLNASRWRSGIAEVVRLLSMARMKRCQDTVCGVVRWDETDGSSVLVVQHSEAGPPPWGRASGTTLEG